MNWFKKTKKPVGEPLLSEEQKAEILEEKRKLRELVDKYDIRIFNGSELLWSPEGSEVMHILNNNAINLVKIIDNLQKQIDELKGLK
jgi:hypothetical protein